MSRDSEGRACAIVGAGVAGLAAGRWLQQQGWSVSLFDKGRRAGGRLASRSSDWGHFDHGSSALSGTGSALQGLLRATTAARPLPASSASAEAVIGSPCINQLAQDWAAGLDLQASVRIEAIQREGSQWLLYGDGAAPERFDRVLVTVPAPQLAALLPGLALPAELERIHYDPAWVLMAVPEPASLPAMPVLTPGARPELAALIREDLKPDAGGSPRLTVQASSAWSLEHLEAEPEWAAAQLSQAAAAQLGIPDRWQHRLAHRWRYARVRQAAGVAYLPLAPGLLYASDGCLGGGGAEAADSGFAAAQALVA